MKTKNDSELNPWSEIKDRVYGKRGTERRDRLEMEAEGFSIGLMLKQAREMKQLTQEDLSLSTRKALTSLSRERWKQYHVGNIISNREKGLGGKCEYR